MTVRYRVASFVLGASLQLLVVFAREGVPGLWPSRPGVNYAVTAALVALALLYLQGWGDWTISSLFLLQGTLMVLLHKLLILEPARVCVMWPANALLPSLAAECRDFLWAVVACADIASALSVPWIASLGARREDSMQRLAEAQQQLAAAQQLLQVANAQLAAALAHVTAVHANAVAATAAAPSA